MLITGNFDNANGLVARSTADLIFGDGHCCLSRSSFWAEKYAL